MNLFDVYPLFPIEPVRANACQVFDKEGKEYLDLYGGHAVISIGHSHPHYVRMISEQLGKIGFYSNSIINSLQKELADKLGEISGYNNYQLFLCNSGAEANENALKLASFITKKKKVIAFEGAFHGRTSAAVRITDNKKIVASINEGFEVNFLALNDLDAVEKALCTGDVAAVIIEGIQGIAGIRLPNPDFLDGLGLLTKKYGCMLILDEIQSGYGRSGKFFAHQYSNVVPDIITTAKGMANGFPIGGVFISPNIKPEYGMLGTTFGGNHLACAAAIAVLDVLENEQLIANAETIGKYLLNELNKLAENKLAKIKAIRGLGLMIGIEFEGEMKKIREELLFSKQIFTGASGKNIIRLLPPLCLSNKEAELFVKELTNVLTRS